MVTLAANPDGEANDTRLVRRALPLACAAVASPRLWVADRQFCDLIQPASFAAGDDHFLTRYSRNRNFAPDPGRAAVSGAEAAGRPFTQEWGCLGAAGGRRRYYVRRVTLPQGQQSGAHTSVHTLLESAKAANGNKQKSSAPPR